MREPPGPCGAGRLRVACCPDRSPAAARPARPLAVRAASFARRVGSKPGQAPQASRRPPIGRGACVLPGQAPPPPTGAAAWPRHRPPAPRPSPAGHAAASNRSGLAVCVLPGQALPPPTGAAAWPRHRPPAPRPGPAAAAWPRRHRVSKPALSLLINFACNSPPLSCRFVSVCSVMSLVFLNCMRLMFRTGPAAIRRYRERANLSLSDLPIDQTGCVRG